jgi:hypothetical protein
MKKVIEALTIFVIWVGLAVTSGFLMGATSPHGMAGFIYSSVVLGVVGGVAFSAFGSLTSLGLDAPSKIYVGGGIGLVLGALSFPISTAIAGYALNFPRDWLQLALLAYLCILGVSLGCLTVVIKHRMKNLDSNDRN